MQALAAAATLSIFILMSALGASGEVIIGYGRDRRSGLSLRLPWRETATALRDSFRSRGAPAAPPPAGSDPRTKALLAFKHLDKHLDIPGLVIVSGSCTDPSDPEPPSPEPPSPEPPSPEVPSLEPPSPEPLSPEPPSPEPPSLDPPVSTHQPTALQPAAAKPAVAKPAAAKPAAAEPTAAKPAAAEPTAAKPGTPQPAAAKPAAANPAAAKPTATKPTAAKPTAAKPEPPPAHRRQALLRRLRGRRRRPRIPSGRTRRHHMRRSVQAPCRPAIARSPAEDLLHVLRAVKSWRKSHALSCRKA
jgi:hypothetical protein